jgi:hypothetical protein
LPHQTGVAGDSSVAAGITAAIIAAGDRQHALKIDLKSTWWSTRLYLIASLAQRLTQARRILVVDTSPTRTPPPGLPSPPPDERFIGQLSTGAILAVIGAKSPALHTFADKLQARPLGYDDVTVEITELLALWDSAFTQTAEVTVKIDLTAEILRRWFGDAMLTQALEIADLRRASAVDILRLLDYPNEFVPVLTRHDPSAEGALAAQRVDVVDKAALNAGLARSYLVELLDRARIA